MEIRSTPRVKRPLCVAAYLLTASTTVAAEPNPAYLDASQPVELRVHDLVSRMTLEEKASMMENTTPGVPRLGIPKYNWWSEALHGVANAGIATVFPQAIGLAATWDVPLHREVAQVIGIEGRAKFNSYVGTPEAGTIFHGLTFWSPNINIFRDPRWGRGQETYGEDPFLTSRFGVAFVQGLQGDNPNYLQAAACGKHFAVHSGPESLRHGMDVAPPESDLYETYFPAFEALVREGHVETIMVAYNSLYGEPCSINSLLYSRLAKWGFDGQVTSDCGSVGDLIHSYKRARDDAEAEAMVLKAGLNVTCGSEAPGIVKAVREGLITEERVNQQVAPLLRTMIRLGFFDPKDRVPYTAIKPSENDSPEHAALAIRAAEESIVLLKNDGALPLRRGSIHRIAVIGPNATSVPVLVGNYNGTPSKPVTVLAGLKDALGPNVQITYAHGCDYASMHPGLRPVANSWYNGDYFANAELLGVPAVSRSDRPILLHSSDSKVWWGHLPDGLPNHDISVRWKGELLTTLGGDYTLVAKGRGGFRLSVGDKQVIDSWNPTPEERATIREIRRTIQLADNASVPFTLEYTQGNGPADVSFEWELPAPDSQIAEAVTAAKDADAVVFVGGISAQLEGEEMQVPYDGFSGGDRQTIELPSLQLHLLQMIEALGKPVILVNMSGSAVAMPWAAEHINAIVQAFYPGEAGGAAVADVLVGKYSPAGRLPVTFYRATEDLPAFADYNMANRTYRYFRGKALFPFGFGLSYSKFAYSDLRAVNTGSNSVAVSVHVKNTGDCDGDEVIELYATPPADAHLREIQALCGFSRVHLSKGETKTIEIVVPSVALRRWSKQIKDYYVPSGNWTIGAGASSADIRRTMSVKL